jgi:hypothetical protein
MIEGKKVPSPANKKARRNKIIPQAFRFDLEAASGFEPENGGFADLCLTTWLCRHKKMERETGFEPATSTLARSHSTTELFPLS